MTHPLFSSPSDRRQTWLQGLHLKSSWLVHVAFDKAAPKSRLNEFYGKTFYRYAGFQNWKVPKDIGCDLNSVSRVVNLFRSDSRRAPRALSFTLHPRFRLFEKWISSSGRETPGCRPRKECHPTGTLDARFGFAENFLQVTHRRSSNHQLKTSVSEVI